MNESESDESFFPKLEKKIENIPETIKTFSNKPVVILKETIPKSKKI